MTVGVLRLVALVAGGAVLAAFQAGEAAQASGVPDWVAAAAGGVLSFGAATGAWRGIGWLVRRRVQAEADEAEDRRAELRHLRAQRDHWQHQAATQHAHAMALHRAAVACGQTPEPVPPLLPSPARFVPTPSPIVAP